MNERYYSLPSHLPDKLTICCWIWAWIAQGRPDEPYGDLERAIIQTVDRGFNCIRADAGLNWCFDLDGNPRGELAFRQWIEGYSSNLRTVNGKGGARHDVLKRVINLMELAKKHGVYVILTSWEYQDSTWHVADPKIRAEVYGIPEEERLMALARQHDRLLCVLKERGLEKNVAFIEPHNETEYSEFPKGEENKRLHTEAIAFLRDRHPDILVSADHASQELDIIPDNTQVYDMHLYSGPIMYWEGIWGQTIWHPDFDRQNPKKLPIMQKMLKEDVVPWDVFMEKAQNIREFWREIDWLYENLNNAEWDRWWFEHFDEYWPRVKATTLERFAQNGQEAKRRGIPAVFDEGGWFYPPLGSRFDESPQGIRLFDLMCDEAIKHDYWGFMCTTYNGPEQPVWTVNPDWLREVNERFRSGTIMGVS